MKSSFARFAASAASFAWRNASVVETDVTSNGFVVGAELNSVDRERFA
jgi:hypothetical protein